MSIYAVNGKEPSAAWIESLDPEAVTSSVATDLVGTNHGTLTNMDLTADPDTARIADTGAGGVRAVAFDGSNDYVTIPHNSVLNPGSNPFSISVWIKPPNSNQFGPICQKRMADGAFTQLYSLAVAADGLAGSSGKKIAFTLLFNGSLNARSSRTTADVADGNWHHVVAIWTGSTIEIWVDGTNRSLTTETTGGTVSALNPSGALRLATNVPGASHYSGRQDDFRLYHGYAFDAADVAFLYAGGAGRGVVVAGGKKRPRINGSLINSGLCRSSI